jgi:DNA-binding MarR family transcriptional regulator
MIRMKSPDPSTVTAWARLMKAQAKALASVETSLKAAHLPPLAWYDVLLELERTSEGIRPFELQAELLLPQYSMSRLLDRMEAAGYVRRVSCNDDGRGQLLFVTSEGADIRKQMWAVYGPVIQNAISDKLSPPDVRKLADLLAALLE